MIIFIIGIGSKLESSPPRYLNRGMFFDKEDNLETAIDTPRIALAPKLDLFEVPSISINKLSIFS